VIDILRFFSKLLFVFLLINIVCAPPALLNDDPPDTQTHDHFTGFAPVRTKAVIVALVDDAFSNIENDIIQETVYTLEYQTNDTIKIILVPQNEMAKPLTLPTNATIYPIMIRKVETDNPQVMAVDDSIKGPMLGFYDAKASPVPTIIIAYARIQYANEYQGVVMHELLHSIGMEHSHYEWQLMYPAISASCMGMHDVLQLAHMFGTNPDDMHACESDSDEPVCLRDYEGNY